MTRFFKGYKNGGVSQNWYYDGKLIFAKKLEPTGMGWRGETNISIAHRDGSWRFELIGVRGVVLQAIEFVIAHTLHGFRGRITGQAIPSSPLRKPSPSKAKLTMAKTSQAKSSTTQSTPIAPTKTATKVIPKVKMIPNVKAIPMAKGIWHYHVGLGVDFAKIDSTQNSNAAKSVLYSNPMAEAIVRASYVSPKKTLQTDAFAQVEQNSYANASNKSFEGMPSSLSTFGVGQTFRNISPTVLPFVGFIIQQDFFDVATSSTNLKLNSVFVPQLQFGLKLNIGTYHKIENQLRATGIYEFAEHTSNYNVLPTWGWRLDWQPDFYLKPGRQLGLDIGYESLHQHTSLIDRSRQDLDMQVLYGWSYK